LAMVNWWNENVSEDVERPVLLANRDNDPVVQERVAALQQGDTPTPAQERAFPRGHRDLKKIPGVDFFCKANCRGTI